MLAFLLAQEESNRQRLQTFTDLNRTKSFSITDMRQTKDISLYNYLKQVRCMEELRGKRAKRSITPNEPAAILDLK